MSAVFAAGRLEFGPLPTMDQSSGRRPAILVSHLDPGGKEACVVALANALRRAGCAPVVVCFERAGVLAAQLDDVPLLMMDKRPGNDLLLPWRLARLFRRHNIDLVHCHNWGTLVEGAIAARAARLPVVHTQHGLDYGITARPGDVSRARTLAKQITGRMIHRIAAVSSEVATMLVDRWRIPAARVTVIHNGIDVPASLLTDDERAQRRARFGAGDREVLVGSVGGLRAVKDYGNLITAVGQLVAEGAPVRCIVAGDGPERVALTSQIKALGLAGRMTLLGQRGDVRELLPLMDVFALSSVSEGISIAILEAMAAGLPVVATRVGGNAEIVETGRTGVLVASRAPGEFADALRSLIADPARRLALGRAGRLVVQTRFSMAQMTGNYRALYSAASQGNRQFDPRT